MRTLLEMTWADYRDEKKTVDAMMAVMEEEAAGIPPQKRDRQRI